MSVLSLFHLTDSCLQINWHCEGKKSNYLMHLKVNFYLLLYKKNASQISRKQYVKLQADLEAFKDIF